MEDSSKISTNDDLAVNASTAQPRVLEGNRKVGKAFYDHKQMELARMRAELRLTSYIVQMTKKPLPPNTPDLWNSLKPYAGTRWPEFALNLPNDTYVGGLSRMTVHNVVDPIEDVRIDQTKVLLPEIHMTRGQMIMQKKKAREEILGKDTFKNFKTKPLPWSQKKGSTNLTPFAKVKYQRPALAMRKGVIDYADVSCLRQQINEMRLNRSKSKSNCDYKRTKDDFIRMDLNVARDRSDQLHRFLFDQACVTFFGPSTGAVKAYKQSTN